MAAEVVGTVVVLGVVAAADIVVVFVANVVVAFEVVIGWAWLVTGNVEGCTVGADIPVGPVRIENSKAQILQSMSLTTKVTATLRYVTTTTAVQNGNVHSKQIIGHSAYHNSVVRLSHSHMQ